MADIEKTNSQIMDVEVIEASEFAPGSTQKLTRKAPMPLNAKFSEWTLNQQSVAMKMGPWSNEPFNSILVGLAYANAIGADPLCGDIFPTGGGRWGTSNKFKLRKARETGLIEGMSHDFEDLKQPLGAGFEKCVLKTDLECTVTIHVKGWTQPLVSKGRLSRWFKANNPNWCTNPEHMLKLNTTAHAVEYINPGGTEIDEAPPVPFVNDAVEVEKALEAAKLSMGSAK